MSASARMALLYVLLFGATGVTLPFAGLWMEAQGLDGAQIGLLLAAPQLARAFTGPALAVWADGFRRRRSPIAILGFVAAAGYAGAGWAEALPLRAILWFVGATAAAALIPLSDVLTMRLAERRGFSFSVPRGMGSVAFVVANVVMGALLVRWPADGVIAWATAAMVALAVTAVSLVPPEGVRDDESAPRPDRLRGVARLLADRSFVVALLAVGAVQATHAFYYGFSAILWREQGVSEGAIGLLWGFSVVVEVAFMWWVEPWRRRRGGGARTLMLFGAGAAILRWAAMAAAPPLWLLWPLQALHALSFAATFLAGLELMQRLAPRNSQTAAQTLSSAVSSGVAIGLATLASGPLHDWFGAGGYLAMAGLATIGGALAWRISAGGPAAGATASARWPSSRRAPPR